MAWGAEQAAATARATTPNEVRQVDMRGLPGRRPDDSNALVQSHVRLDTWSDGWKIKRRPGYPVAEKVGEDNGGKRGPGVADAREHTRQGFVALVFGIHSARRSGLLELRQGRKWRKI